MDFKEMKIDGLTSFAQGGTGECFRIGDDQILKLYYEGFQKERALQEKRNAKTAFVAGIPTPVSFDLIKANGRYGIIYELINSKTLSEVLQENPADAKKTGIELGILAKTIHTATVRETDFPKSTEKIKKALPLANYLDEKTLNNITAFLKALDTATTYVHGDFHTNNIILTNNEIMLIDMGSFSIGSPLFDLAVLHFSFFDSPESIKGDISAFNGLDRDTRNMVWSSFIEEYFKDKSSFEKQEQLQLLDKVILLIRLRFEALYGNRASEDYCKDIREEVMKEFG